MALETLMDRKTDYSWDWENKSEYGYKHVSPAGYLSTDMFNFKETVGDEWDSIIKITTVRNPWSRLWDFYTWHFTMKKRPIKRIEQIIYDHTVNKKTFDEWIYFLKTNTELDWWGEIFNQKIMRKDCDHVIRYEYIYEDVDKIFKGLNVPSAHISHPGQWYAEDDSYIMTEDTKNTINNFCIDDIKEYGYKYNGRIS